VHVRDPARRHHQGDVVADELERVAVRRDDGRLHAGLVREGGERRDHVVGLPALVLEVLVAERLDDRRKCGNCSRRRSGIGCGPPCRRPPPPRPSRCARPARVPRHGDALRSVVREQLEEHVREAEQRVRGKSLARHELLGQREERPVGQVVAVHEEELGVARGRVVELELGPGQRLRHASESMRLRGA
jgi:hypothetical protein